MIGKGPKISMHFREKFGSTTFTKGNNPGPGAYTPEDQPGRAGTAKVRGFGFGSAARLPKEKHSENPGPGTFFFFKKQKNLSFLTPKFKKTGHYGCTESRKKDSEPCGQARLRRSLKSSRR